MSDDVLDAATDYETILVTRYGPALVVTVNRPRALNALAQQVVAELLDLTGRLVEALPSVDAPAAGEWVCRGVIVTGTGEKAFVAGADIREMSGMTPEQAEAYARDMHRVTLNLEALPVPVIAAVNGFALGGGCELAMACDFIYASENAAFGQPEVSLGLVPGFGGSVRLQQRVGVGIARELIMTGRRITAAEAHRIGLVNQVFADHAALLDAARDTVDTIAAQAPTAVANAKATMNAVAHRSVADGLDVEAAAFRAAFTTEDSRIGRDAFLSKESASFSGR
ncbi:enoyl-CoA hydratase/isomerase family protein [Zhihengliuella halotolerans]|uniref:enoyl-CoA hydratase n=1 Tax=Zhihengliuella halotolerans TaxID=370736 RepID=A0A4Q8AHM4_9MICC|nr:enoyl-CoA hydratase-related protein [Zhihengliuella halotolerans]RZU63199.1 short chain enoyl-CoA hydratase [Zhihengliuella halotolerans]